MYLLYIIAFMFAAQTTSSGSGEQGGGSGEDSPPPSSPNRNTPTNPLEVNNPPGDETSSSSRRSVGESAGSSSSTAPTRSSVVEMTPATAPVTVSPRPPRPPPPSSGGGERPNMPALSVGMQAITVGGTSRGSGCAGGVHIGGGGGVSGKRSREGEGPSSVTPNEQGRFPCTQCNRVFDTAKALFGHMRIHTDRDWTGVNPPPIFGPGVYLDAVRRSNSATKLQIQFSGDDAAAAAGVREAVVVEPPPPPPPPVEADMNVLLPDLNAVTEEGTDFCSLPDLNLPPNDGDNNDDQDEKSNK